MEKKMGEWGALALAMAVAISCDATERAGADGGGGHDGQGRIACSIESSLTDAQSGQVTVYYWARIDVEPARIASVATCGLRSTMVGHYLTESPPPGAGELRCSSTGWLEYSGGVYVACGVRYTDAAGAVIAEHRFDYAVLTTR